MSKLIHTKRRRGFFKATRALFLEDDEAMHAIQKDMIVLDAQHSYGDGVTTFYAVHPAFDLIENDECAPEYIPEITFDEEADSFTVQWSKKN